MSDITLSLFFMAKFSLIVFGKSKFPFVEEGSNMLLKRLSHYYPTELITLTPKYKSTDPTQVKKTEATALSKVVKPNSKLILLDENGKSYSSREFANSVEHMLQSPENVVFVIGGAFGFDDSIKQQANSKLSFSKMTFSHQMFKLIFLEQFYRACTIIKGESYHND